MTKTVSLDKVRNADARAFSAFLMGRAPGAGVPERPDPDKAGLGRDAEGRVIAQYKGVTLARAGFDKGSGRPVVEILPVTPEKSHAGVVKLFERAYEAWTRTATAEITSEVRARVQELLDPPKGGAPQVTLESVTRAQIEILSLKDVLREVLPPGVELAKFERNDQRIRVYYELAESGVRVPLMSAWHTEKDGTVMRSGDGVSPAPVAFFINLLEEAERYNLTTCGPKRIREANAGVSSDTSDPEVMAAFARYLETGSEVKIQRLNAVTEVALSPTARSVTVYIDRKMIAQMRPLDDAQLWVRPGYGWSSRLDFAQRAIVDAGRRMIAGKVIDAGPGAEWESGLEANLE